MTACRRGLASLYTTVVHRPPFCEVQERPLGQRTQERTLMQRLLMLWGPCHAHEMSSHVCTTSRYVWGLLYYSQTLPLLAGTFWTLILCCRHQTKWRENTRLLLALTRLYCPLLKRAVAKPLQKANHISLYPVQRRRFGGTTKRTGCWECVPDVTQAFAPTWTLLTNNVAGPFSFLPTFDHTSQRLCAINKHVDGTRSLQQDERGHNGCVTIRDCPCDHMLD